MLSSAYKPTHYYNAPRREMLRFIPDSVLNVLEVGCGEGQFGFELKSDRLKKGLSVEVVGIELNRECAAVARSKLDSVIELDLNSDTLDLPPNHYDCVICNDVLEHLLSPWDLLRKVRGGIKPDGYVIASIPNIRYWGVIKDLVFKGKFTYASEGVLDHTHLRFFTRNSIQEMFDECGYEVCTVVGINSHVRGWKFDLLEFLSRKRFSDIQYLQFAVVAKLRSVPSN